MRARPLLHLKCVAALAVVAVAALGTSGRAVATPPAAATDLLPTLAPLHRSLEEHDLVRDPRTGQILLRFSAGIANSGAGPFEILGQRDAASARAADIEHDVMPAFQRIQRSDGTTRDVPVGILEYHPEHHHFHFVGATTYRLRDSVGNVVREAPKVSFCLVDVEPIDPDASLVPVTVPPIQSCAHNPYATFVDMRVSIGWADIYDKSLVGQAFDVTDLMNLPAQTYRLEQTTNPDGVLLDTNGAPLTDSVEVVIGRGMPVGVGSSRPGV